MASGVSGMSTETVLVPHHTCRETYVIMHS